MYRLNLLGGASLEGASGLLRGRVVQRRQLALLALLAGSRIDAPGRDKITGIMWPETSPSRARSRLSDTLHVIRKSLGAEAVLAVGDGLALNQSVVATDVRDFRDALEVDDRREALSLYGGPFLDGFRADRGVAFERWADGERGRLRRSACRAASELAAACEESGDLEDAAKWTRRRLRIDPHDEVAARKLAELLDGTGDRSGAVRVLQDLAERLRDDLELDVSAETAAVMRDLREGTGRHRTSSDPGQDRVRSLAVLPLDDLSPGDSEAHITSGIQDALIGALSRIDGLRVISRTSTLAVGSESRPVHETARELGVDALMEGAVVRTGDRVRIQLQLVKARPDERHLWSEAYERDLDEVLAIHSEVADAVARQLRGRVSARADRLARIRRVEPAMYEAYLRGVHHLGKFTPEGRQRGLEYLHRAIDEDPADPLPYAALALAHSQIGHESGEPGKHFPRAKEAAERALEIDDSIAEAHEAIAETKLYWEWDWRGAEEAFDRALALNPSLAVAHAHRGWYLHLRRRWEAGTNEMRKAEELDPLVPLYPAWLGWQLLLMGRPAEALEAARRALELQDDFPVGLYVLGAVHAVRQHFDDALDAHRKARTASPDWTWGLGHTLALAGREEEARDVADRMGSSPTPMTPFGLAVIHAELGETDEAFRWLEAAFELRFSWMPWMAVYPLLSSLHDDPRYADMVNRLDLPEPWNPAAETT
mgnify:CR=1 FL=1